MKISKLHACITTKPGIVEAHIGNGVYVELQVPNKPEHPFGVDGEILVVYVDHRFPKDQPPAMYGFKTEEDRALFRLIVDTVTGVGPSVALKVLGGMPAGQFKAAVIAGDTTMLATIKGIGPKSAQRLIFELKAKLEKDGSAEAWKDQVAGLSSPAAADAELALIALGYKTKDAKTAVKNVLLENPSAAVDDLVRGALQRVQ